MRQISLSANIYRQFDADYTLDVPGEGYGGWTKQEVTLPLDRTALVVMHAWKGKLGEFPGWDRCVEYRPRSFEIIREVFPPLLSAARAAGMPLIHVAGEGNYYKSLPGYPDAAALAGPPPNLPPGACSDESLAALRQLCSQQGCPGPANREDIARGFAGADFPNEARPITGEYICDTTPLLNAVCRKLGVNHLVYVGFAINWCLLLSPGGMSDMKRLGYLCSTIREAVTAVENKESARTEAHKEEALWRISVGFGLVFDLKPFIAALAEA